MQLQEVITKNPETIRPESSILEATRIMRDRQIGFLPVTDNGRILGVVTDRDIVVRGIARGYDPKTTTIREVMTFDVVKVEASEPIERALETMASSAINRLIVTDRGKIVGILTSGDAATVCKGDSRAGTLTAAIHRRAVTQKPQSPPPDAQFVSD